MTDVEADVGVPNYSAPEAVAYAFNAMCMGPPWVMWDTMTWSLKYLYVQHGLRESFTVSFKKHE
eukprot:57058-Pyramimonas_sp.AAC.1